MYYVVVYVCTFFPCVSVGAAAFVTVIFVWDACSRKAEKNENSDRNMGNLTHEHV